ncbi:ATP-binding protein [Anaerolineales bacterium HSG25]|nr:ATP-binding protein [Anaerolineales bacterium HSG25]
MTDKYNPTGLVDNKDDDTLMLADEDDDALMLADEDDDALGLADEDDTLGLADEDDLLGLADEDETESAKSAKDDRLPDTWKIMIVDDDHEVHAITQLALKRFTYEGKGLTMIQAYSGAEAKELITQHPDTALMLLDVVMEKNDAGLQVAKFIRTDLNNELVRIILRTGQPGEAPEESVIVDYDINDYRTKLELTRHKLFTVMVATLRSYRDLLTIDTNRKELENLYKDLAKRNLQLEDINIRLQKEIAERKRLEAIRMEQERLRIQNQFLEREAQELAKLNADKDKFFSIVAHDLKGPFQPLLGMSELLPIMADDITPNDIREMGDSIYRSAKNIYDLLENLLQWSRMQMGRMTYQPQKVELQEIALQSVKLLTANASEKGIILDNNIDEGMVVNADGHMLDTVIRNLVSNALKFTPKGGSITLSATVRAKEELINRLPSSDKDVTIDHDFIEVSISDTGIGISQEDITKLFRIEKHHTTLGTSNEKGTGLGLIICQEMVEHNGGCIWVESELGKGTTFKFTVPQAD